jgi:hypothetical protein
MTTSFFPDLETGVQSLLDGSTSIPKRRETLENFKKTAEEKNWNSELLQEEYGIKAQWVSSRRGNFPPHS